MRELTRLDILHQRLAHRYCYVPGTRVCGVAAERSADTGEWMILRDWQTVRRLNEMVENLSVLRRPRGKPEALGAIQSDVASALRLIESEVPTLKTGFKVPLVEALVVIWPGTESATSRDQERATEADSMDDLE